MQTTFSPILKTMKNLNFTNREMLSYKLVNINSLIFDSLLLFSSVTIFFLLSLSITIFPLCPPSFSVSGPGRASVAWAPGRQGQGKGPRG